MKKHLVKFYLTVFLLFLLSILVLMFKPHEGLTIKTNFATDSVKFCITGDTGMNSKVQQDIAELIKAQQCDRVIILGDIIYPDGVSSLDDPQIKEKFDDYFLPLTQIDKKPLIALINGNHDYSGNISEWMKAVESRPWVFMPSRYYMEDVSGFCFYYIDSNLFLRGNHRVNALSQIRWLQEVRAKNQKNCHKEIILTHHPYKSYGRHHKTDDLLKWLYRWLFINRSDFMISGHSHFVKDIGKVGKTQLLVSGAGGAIEENSSGGILIVELGLKDQTLSYYFP